MVSVKLHENHKFSRKPAGGLLNILLTTHLIKLELIV